MSSPFSKEQVSTHSLTIAGTAGLSLNFGCFGDAMRLTKEILQEYKRKSLRNGLNNVTVSAVSCYSINLVLFTVTQIT